jgi:hypothetical protein
MHRQAIETLALWGCNIVKEMMALEADEWTDDKGSMAQASGMMVGWDLQKMFK